MPIMLTPAFQETPSILDGKLNDADNTAPVRD